MITGHRRPGPVARPTMRGRAGLYAGVASLVGAALVAVSGFVLAMASNAAATWTHPNRSAIRATPADYGLRYEDVTLVTEDGLRLVAWYLPSENSAAIIMLHGIGANRSWDLSLARDLAHGGYGVLTLDLRAHGESEGSVSSLGVREVMDVRAATRYLFSRTDVDPKRIGIFGASLGAAVAIMSTAEIPEIRAVAADSSFASIDWVVQNQFEKLEHVPGWLAPVVVAIGSAQAGVNSSDIAPAMRIGRIAPRPVMLVHGDRDESFLLQNAFLLFEAAGEPKELYIEEDAGHIRDFNEAYADRLRQFFDRALR